MRSLSPADYFLLQHRIAHVQDSTWKAWMIAHSTWMFNGHCYLGDQTIIPLLFEKYCQLPKQVIESLLHIVIGLNNRASKAIELVPIFCYESLSRLLWRQYQGNSYPSMRQIGLPGIENLGSNTAQRMWSSFNTIEDLNEQFEAGWSHAKFVASSMAPKGIEQMNRTDKQARETQAAKKQELFDHTYYVAMEILDKDDKFVGTETQLPKMVSASTEDELMAEMRRALTGEKDWHDRMIDSYKQHILDKQRKETQERQQRIDEAMRKANLEGEPTEAFQLVGYTLEELQDRLGYIGNKVQTIQDDDGSEYLTNKYMREVEIGAINFKTMKVEKFVPNNPIGAPTGSLNQQVQGRTVTLGEG